MYVIHLVTNDVKTRSEDLLTSTGPSSKQRKAAARDGGAKANPKISTYMRTHVRLKKYWSPN